MTRPILMITMTVASLLHGSIARGELAGQWVSQPLSTAKTHHAPGVTIGGEGGQWPRSLAIDAIDGNFLLYGIDVGGVFRSLDGGDTWEPANVGFSPRGASAFAIDPRNPDRAIAVGVNSGAHDHHGLYLTTDRAASWTPVHTVRMSGISDWRQQVAFDPQSYDVRLGHCTDAYWSRIADDKPNFGTVENNPALYRTSDGGLTWERLPGSADYAGGTLVTHPTRNGVVYVATDDGIYVSGDRAESFQRIAEGKFTGLAVSPSEPNTLWALQTEQMRVSRDGGQTWRNVTVDEAGRNTTSRDENASPRQNVEYQQVSVSAIDPDRIAFRSVADNYRWRLHTTDNGGRTWRVARFDNNLAFLPFNVRQWVVAWDPDEPEVAHSFGGAWPTRTSDGGKTFAWNSDGLHVMLVGGAFHFNPTDPDILFLGSQDQNGGVTTDGGQTFRYTPVSDFAWGGFTYGAMAADKNTLFVGNATGWGSDRTLRISRDGGRTWTELANVVWSKNLDDRERHGLDTSFVDPADPDVFFAGPFRSDNAGQTWQKMAGCDGVVFASPAQPFTLFGIDHPTDGRSAVVRSDDHGMTWTTVVELDGFVSDVAYAPTRGALLFVHNHELKRFRDGRVELIDTPRDQFGRRRVTSVAFDPRDPDRVYATQHMNTHTCSASALGSKDGGETWHVLNVNEPLDGTTRDGGREAMWVRVHPDSGEAWFSTSCFGVWKWRPAAR